MGTMSMDTSITMNTSMSTESTTTIMKRVA